MSVIKKETIDVRRVGTALIGGDFSGNARGTSALDIQTARGAVTQVASGFSAITIGLNATASDDYTLAIGYEATASGYRSVAAGFYATASADRSLAFGPSCEASGGGDSVAVGSTCTGSGSGSSALGYQATARIDRTTNICGPQINRKDNGEAAANAFRSFCGVVVTLLSKEVDMEVVADHTLTLSANAHFWLDEVGIIATNIVNLVAQPTVRYGITGDLDKHGVAAATTDLTATLKREIETPLVPEDGETSLTGGVTIAADADTFLGRFYWKGMFIEDE